jgi:hypothetical protein
MENMTWIWYFILGIVYVAILYALVKPGSPAANGVNAVSNAIATLITTAVGGTPANVSPNPVPPGGILT